MWKYSERQRLTGKQDLYVNRRTCKHTILINVLSYIEWPTIVFLHIHKQMVLQTCMYIQYWFLIA
mgnify:CR=1 FL=1